MKFATKQHMSTASHHPISRPGTLPVLNDLLAFRRDPLNFWLEAGRQGPVVRVGLGPTLRFWVVTDADLFQEILAKKSKNFPRSILLRDRRGMEEYKTVFNADTYEEWLWRRRLLQPAFHMRELTGFSDTFVAETARLVDELDSETPFDLVHLMKTLTMRIICKTMFSATLDETDVLQDCFERVTQFGYRRMSSIIKWPLWVPTRHRRDAEDAYRTRWQIVEGIVQERLSSGRAKGDLLDMLIAAHLDEDGRSFSGEDLVSEMLSIIFAGHDTTAMTMVWLLYTVSQNAEVEQKLSKEVDSVLNGRLPTLEDIDNMPYTHQLIQETLRVYPTVYLTLREAESDDTIGNYAIPANTQLVINIRGIHRDPAHWEQPDRFWPERFTEENNQTRHKFAYIPFLAGPKKCIGDAFAMLEMRLVIPTIIQRTRLRYAADKPPKERAGFVMDTDRPVWMERCEL